MNRRLFIALLAGSGLLAGAYALVRPRGGFLNPCLQAPMPAALGQHEIIQAAWQGIDIHQFWDVHVHLVGLGHGNTGARVNPDMQSLGHPMQYVQYQFYLNAACTQNAKNIDAEYVRQLIRLQAGLRNSFEISAANTMTKSPGKSGAAKLMLLAFDQVYDESGNKQPAASAFYIPNKYAQSVVKSYPDQFEWIASVHPYRKDALEQLQWSVSRGARAIKWLPSAMGINPGSSLCDAFYEALVKFKLPLLVHAGSEVAVAGHGGQDLGNPLLLRRPLERGVKVIIAHSASSGEGVDLDQGSNGKMKTNFELFTRLMDDSNYQNNLFGEISAITQVNRVGLPLETILKKESWHGRMLNGSDYPLPAILPLFSLEWLRFKDYISAVEASVLSDIRLYNPLLFDFVLKRTIRFQGLRLPTEFFHTRRFFIAAS
ncbi:MAG: amidohydrolase family protein [Acidiferrobacterales bacterium]